MKKSGTRTPRTAFAIALLGVLLVHAPAHAGERSAHPGLVDGTPFIDIADPEGELIEVNLSGKLLELLTTRAIRRHDSDIAAILADLVSVQAIVAGIHREHREEVRREIRQFETKLGRDGWERFVRVRDGKEEYGAYVHFDRKDEIDGLVVMGFMEEEQVIFVNLAGRVDVERIALLGERLGVPGLDDLPSSDDVDERRKTRRKKSDRPSSDRS